MARQVLRGLRHDNAVAYPDDGIETQLAIGIGVINAAHHPAVMDNGQNSIENSGCGFNAKRDKHEPDKHRRYSDE